MSVMATIFDCGHVTVFFCFCVPPGMFDAGDCCDTRSISDHSYPDGSTKVTMDFIYNNQCHLEEERLPHGKANYFLHLFLSVSTKKWLFFGSFQARQQWIDTV